MAKFKIYRQNNRLKVKICEIPANLLSKYGCINCKHLNQDFISCAAYPERIPEDILIGLRVHNKKQKGQKGSIIFELDTEEKINDRYELLNATKVLNRLFDELNRLIDRVSSSEGIDLSLGYKKGLMFSIRSICEIYNIDIETDLKEKEKKFVFSL